MFLADHDYTCIADFDPNERVFIADIYYLR